MCRASSESKCKLRIFILVFVSMSEYNQKNEESANKLEIIYLSIHKCR